MNTSLKIITLVAIWRILLTAVAFIASLNFSYHPTFFASELLEQYGTRLVTTWSHFDGILYLQIAQHGYTSWGSIQAFFPLYPLLIRYVSLNGFINPLFTGVLISTTALVLAVYFLKKLIRLDYSNSVAWKAIALLLVAPTSYYFTAVYTESLFLLWIVLFFYHLRTKHFAKAAFWAFLASLTRLVGVALVFSFIYEYWLTHKKVKPSLVLGGSPLIALGSYMMYLKHEFNDALYFYTVQSGFGANRETSRIILLYQVFYRYIKMFLTVPLHEKLFYIIFQEFVAGLIGFFGIVVGWFTMRRSYVIFVFFAYLVPTLTGTFSSLPRYLLPLFPLYILIAKFFPNWLFILTLVGSTIMLTINLIFFTQGLWVS